MGWEGCKNMGNMATVRCTGCGYKAGIAIGGTMAGFEEYSAWPVTCLNCKTITNANTRKSPLACGKCGSKNVIGRTLGPMRATEPTMC
jgi:DNA-directed RNA polymerase subunit RPC12/RpoP